MDPHIPPANAVPEGFGGWYGGGGYAEDRARARRVLAADRVLEQLGIRPKVRNRKPDAASPCPRTQRARKTEELPQQRITRNLGSVTKVW